MRVAEPPFLHTSPFPPPHDCRKELLWPYIREFADNGVTHVRRTLAALAEAGRFCELYAVHGHYADGGEV
jgi:sucrose-phosphate synthase